MSDPNPFGPGLLRFLRALSRNNNRKWFEAHKEDYEADVREPALAFIQQMERHVQRISPHLTAKPKKVGGSLMRVYRDVRFSKDKRPYKTNVGIQFRHEKGKDVHAPGLYLHIEPKRLFLGCGMWRPDKEALAAVRQAILDDPKGWKRQRDAKKFRSVWDLGGDSLKRAPRGYDPEHPLIEDLKRTDHIAFMELPEKALADPGFVGKVADHFWQARNYLRWQAQAIGLQF
jgi:uncharacterized protein (TIGR02453 family)